MTNEPSRKPLTLDEIAIVCGLAPEDAYGADHSPPFDKAETNRLFLEANETLGRDAEALNGLQLLTVLAAHAHANERDEPPPRVYIAMVELAQALLLQSSLSGVDVERDRMVGFIDALSVHFHLFLDQTAKPASDERQALLARRRQQTLMTRHTFYAHHASIVWRRIGEKLETFGRTAFGMSLADASLITMAAAYWVAAMLERSSVGDDVLQWIDRGETAFDLAWTDLFEVHLDVLGAANPSVSVEDIGQLLDRLSHAAEDLAAIHTSHLHLDNPVWRKPFVKHDGRWFCFSPGTLFSSQLDVLSELAGDISKRSGELLGEARGDALEEMVAETLAAMFPHGRLLRSVFWSDTTGNQYETDAILLIDGMVLIFESKACALSLSGRRGGNQWFKDFDDVVVKASLRAWRLEQALRDTSQPTIKLVAESGEIVLAKDEIRHVMRFGISLERVTTASYGLDKQLRKRIESAGALPMPVFTIGDLWQIRDLIGNEGGYLHFFVRRAELEQDFEFLGDELDLIAYYLRTGFVRMSDKAEGQCYSLYGLSDFLRHFQQGTPHFRADVALPKRSTAWWDQLICDQVDRQRTCWTDMVYDLLNVPLASQQRFEEDILSLRDVVRGTPGDRVCQGTLMQAPCQLRPSAFVCIVMGKMPFDERIAAARESLLRLHEAHPDERLWVFVLDADAESKVPALPYYRGIGWGRAVGQIEADGEHVLSGLYFEIDPD